jgi:hypothetical protein
MWIFSSSSQTMINLQPIICASLQVSPSAGVWNDALQRPVKMSHTFTTPFKSLEIPIPSLACRLMDRIGAEVGGVGIVLVAAGLANEVPICQNLTDWSQDAEMREEEENAREVMRRV